MERIETLHDEEMPQLSKEDLGLYIEHLKAKQAELKMHIDEMEHLDGIWHE